jgi:hypothetical protein
LLLDGQLILCVDLVQVIWLHLKPSMPGGTGFLKATIDVSDSAQASVAAWTAHLVGSLFVW